LGVITQPDSQFAAAYQKGISKLNYWDPVYEDSINLIAKLPGIAAAIYRNTYKGGKLIPHDTSLDWAANLSHQMGAPPPPEHAKCMQLSF
jgi:citrate synthase